MQVMLTAYKNKLKETQLCLFEDVLYIKNKLFVNFSGYSTKYSEYGYHIKSGTLLFSSQNYLADMSIECFQNVPNVYLCDL